MRLKSQLQKQKDPAEWQGLNILTDQPGDRDGCSTPASREIVRERV
jgi:hypothetical protein